MVVAHAEVSARPVGGRGRAFLTVWWTLAILSGIAALALAAMGWLIELGTPKDAPDIIDIAVRTVKVLLLSDIYYDPVQNTEAAPLLEYARALGVLASLLVGLRLLALAIGSRLSDFMYALFIGRHHVVIGDGPAAQEYAAAHNAMF